MTSEALRGKGEGKGEDDKKKGIMVARKWKQVKEKLYQNRRVRRNKWKTRLLMVYAAIHIECADFTEALFTSKIYGSAVHAYGFIYAHKKCTAFRVPGCTKFTNSQQQHLQIFLCRLQPNRIAIRLYP